MRIYGVFRKYGRGSFSQFHFYKAFATRVEAKKFCDKKNSNAGCSYTYGFRVITVIGGADAQAEIARLRGALEAVRLNAENRDSVWSLASEALNK